MRQKGRTNILGIRQKVKKVVLTVILIVFIAAISPAVSACNLANGHLEKKYQTVLFKDGDLVLETQKVKTGNAPCCPKNPSKQNYTFIKWCENLENTNEFDFNKGIFATTVVYAHFEPDIIKTYKVEFVLGGGTALSGDKTVQRINEGERINPINNPEMSGFLFNGWYKDESCTIYFDFLTTYIFSDTMIYADWTQKEYCDVTFDENYIKDGSNQSVKETVTPVKGSSIKTWSNPVRAGKKFTGWYDNPDCTGEPFDKDAPINQNMIFYAGWRNYLVFTVNVFYTHEGLGAAFINSGKAPENHSFTIMEDSIFTALQLTMLVPLNVTIDISDRAEIYKFVAFYTSPQLLESEEVDLTMPITQSINLYAKWSAQVKYNTL